MKTIIVDTSSVLFPIALSKYTTELSSDDGEPIESIYKFLEKLLELSEKFSTNKFIFCFEGGNENRKRIYPSYKDCRTKRSPEIEDKLQRLYPQIKTLKSGLEQAGFQTEQVYGYESDDLCASLIYNNPEHDIILLTGDKDLFQCIRPWCSVYNIREDLLYNDLLFRQKKFNLPADQFWRVLALAGDASDGIEGIPKVGMITAVKFLTKTLNPSHKVYSNIINNKQIYLDNSKIVKLPLEGCPELKIKDVQLDFNGFNKFCQECSLIPFYTDIGAVKWNIFFSRREIK